MLEKWGYQVTAVSNGDEAWSVIKEETSPSIAVLDWMMPGIDGVEICSRLKAIDRKIPVYIILLTGRDSKKDISTGLESGASDYMTKPFDNNELKARLRVAERMIALQDKLNSKIDQLRDAIEHVTTLQGILPICMHCHKIRTDDQAWERLESYIELHSDARFSHGLCPECMNKHYSKDLPDNGS